ncbi:MAG: dihydrolipoyl dehydrogenase [Armatimonadota bacterium]
MSERYDIAILGAGPAGYVGAIRAAQLGAKVACVEERELGGTCLNRGCIPSKALISCAEVYEHLKHARDFGLACDEPRIDLERLMAHRDRVVKQLVQGVGFLFKKNGVEHIQGRGRLTARDTIEVENGSDGAVIKAGSILLATGSRPLMPPIPGIADERVYDSDYAVNLDTLPKSMVIIGGGAIGMEFAYIAQAFDVEVTVLEMLDQVMPTEEPEVAEVVAKSLTRKGVKIVTQGKAVAIEDESGLKKVRYETKADQETSEAEATGEWVLVAVGRRSLTSHVGLEEVGVETERGNIQVNERLETSVQGIYAAGDCLRGVGLAHQASHEAIAAVENALGHQGHVNYNAIPSCIFTVPEIASVGLKEVEAREQGYEVTVGKYLYRNNGKALGMAARDGFCKVIADADSRRILGASVVGVDATTMIAELALAVHNELTLEQVTHCIHAHPTLPEITHEAALDAAGIALHQ